MCTFEHERNRDKATIRFLWGLRHNNPYIRHTIRSLCDEVRRSYQLATPTLRQRLYLTHIIGA